MYVNDWVSNPVFLLYITPDSYYTGSDARRMWKGLQTITDKKGKHSRELPSDMSLPYELNHFYARFEASNTAACI